MCLPFRSRPNLIALQGGRVVTRWNVALASKATCTYHGWKGFFLWIGWQCCTLDNTVQYGGTQVVLRCAKTWHFWRSRRECWWCVTRISHLGNPLQAFYHYEQALLLQIWSVVREASGVVSERSKGNEPLCGGDSEKTNARVQEQVFAKIHLRMQCISK